MDSDAVIISKILKGETKEYEKIIDRYEKKIYGFVLRIVGDVDAAQDIAQDTFIKAYQSLGKFSLDKSFGTWIFTIAKNDAFNFLKQRKRMKIVSLNEDVDLSSLEIASASIDNPVETFERKLYLKYVNVILEDIPEKYKTLIYLKYSEGLSYKEISERLDIDIEMVQSRLYMARQMIIKRFKKKEADERQVEKEWIVEKQREGSMNI